MAIAINSPVVTVEIELRDLSALASCYERRRQRYIKKHCESKPGSLRAMYARYEEQSEVDRDRIEALHEVEVLRCKFSTFNTLQNPS